MMNRKDRPIKHITLSPPNFIPPNELSDVYSFTGKMIAQINDITDETICNAIINYAKSEGYTDLYLIDENFVKRAIEREISGSTDREGRWKGAGMGDYYCSLCQEMYSGGDEYNFCPNCGAKMK